MRHMIILLLSLSLGACALNMDGTIQGPFGWRFGPGHGSVGGENAVKPHSTSRA